MSYSVGILGGSFNPPHNAHILLGESAFKFLKIQSLIYMPTRIPSHKNINTGWNGPLRSLMIKMAVNYIVPEEAFNFIKSIKSLKYKAEKISRFISTYKDLYTRFHRNEISVSDLELNRDNISYTIDTIKLLLDLNPEWDISIIIGMDQALVIDTWKDYIELSSVARICAADRGGIKSEEVKKRFPFIKYFPFPEINISSTMIREKINSGQKITGLVPSIIEDFITLIHDGSN